MAWVYWVVIAAKSLLDANGKKGERAVAEAQDELREANNSLSAATGALNRYRQSISNQNIMQAGAEKTEALQTNLIRNLGQTVQQSVAIQTQGAEQAGALAAARAMSGNAGGSQDQIAYTQRLRQNIVEGRLKTNQQLTQYDAGLMRAGIARTSLNSLDNRLILDNIDPVETPGQKGSFLADFAAAFAKNYVSTGGGKGFGAAGQQAGGAGSSSSGGGGMDITGLLGQLGMGNNAQAQGGTDKSILGQLGALMSGSTERAQDKQPTVADDYAGFKAVPQQNTSFFELDTTGARYKL